MQKFLICILAVCNCLNPYFAMALSAPRNITVDGTSVSWTAPSDVGAGIRCYRVYRGEHLYQEVPPSTSLITTGNTDMPVNVQAVDKAGEVSGLARAGAPLWQKTFGGPSGDGIQSVARDSEDNYFISGFFSGSINFGAGVITSSPNLSAFFLAKLAPDGVCEWSKRFVLPNTNLPYTIRVAVDAGGNVIIAGRFAVTINFGGSDLQSQGHTDVFVAKFDPSGNHLWSNSYGGTSDYGDVLDGVVVDSEDNVVIVGYFSESANFGGEWLGAAWSGKHGYVAKYDSDGEHLWSKGFGVNVANQVSGVALDSEDNVLITGSYHGTINFGGSDILPKKLNPFLPGSGDSFIVKLDSDGEHVWSYGRGGQLADEGFAIATDSEDNVIVSGIYYGPSGYPANFGGSDFNAISFDIWLAKYDSSGTHIWSRSVGSSAPDRPYRVLTDSDDNVILAATCNGPANFGGGALTYRGGPDGVLAKFDSDGVHQWSESIGGVGTDYLFDIAIDSEDNVIAGGMFESPGITIGGQDFLNTGTGYDAFLYKRAP